MTDLSTRLERIRNRMRAFAEQPSEKTAESYRALFEVVYAELDVLVHELEPNDRIIMGADPGTDPSMVVFFDAHTGGRIPVTPEEDVAWTERDKL